MSSDEWLRRFNEEYAEEAATSTNDGSDEQFAGADTAETVRVVLDSAGIAGSVVIPADWDESMTPDELGRRVTEAFDDATMRYVSAEADRIQFDEQPVVTHRADAQDAGGSPSSPVARQTVAEIQELAANFYRELDVYAAATKRALNTPTDGTGPNKTVVVHMSAGRITGITIDADWARSARYTEVSSEILSALQQAQREGDRARSQQVPVPPSIARLQELVSDPQAFVRQLGLA
ncbi:hypothetical protein [Actinocrispum wychmicini]|uniref:YbaB/EbfC DNA-binding family protein n=1 Tax=Actinocrispum wychmicini TaxID=1213861 RepID=A0A4R2JJ99_9PSEU|nr:hypothetical protein [Actinocrispum wychmicini]TCO57086.1 hypothetical protein EV192_106563 [Actinocrispum wychmicini]